MVVDDLKQVEIENYKYEADEAERQGNYERVAELRYGRVKEAEKEIDDLKKELGKLKEHDSLIKEEVDTEDIAEVVARWTGIPVSRKPWPTSSTSSRRANSRRSARPSRKSAVS